MIAQYRDARTAKTRGNREIALLSHIWNIAREWSVTDKENPCTRVRRNKEKAREHYAGEQVWTPVYSAAPPELRDAMDLAYLTGQRPVDTIKMASTDIVDDCLLVRQNKRGKWLRIRLRDGEVVTGLGVFLEGLLERCALVRIRTSTFITNATDRRMSAAMLRKRWDEAREAVARAAEENGDVPLASQIRQFQFRDIRPKAATEIEGLGHASKLLGHASRALTQLVYRRLGEKVAPTK